MDAPPVRYVTTSDGLRIAYGVSGKGTPLIFFPGIFYHVQLAWEYPGLDAWLHRLSERFQVIQIDPRGTGMSDRDVSDTLARDDYQRDIEAVVGRLGLERFLMMGVAFGVDLIVDYAAQHPEHVIALVLGTSGTTRSSVMFYALPAEDWDAFLYSIVPRDRRREEADRIVELTRQAADQRNYLLRRRVLTVPGELEERLAKLRTETLVLHTRGYAFTPVEEAMKKAQLSRGTLVLVDGLDAFGDAEQGVRAIETFWGGLSPEKAMDAPAVNGLSAREIEVLRLIASCRSNQQIASELVISLNTVQHHVSSILTKTGVANRTEAAAYAHQHGLI
jgi:DNA-binding NarL/FixJ family response regulator